MFLLSLPRVSVHCVAAQSRVGQCRPEFASVLLPLAVALDIGAVLLA